MLGVYNFSGTLYFSVSYNTTTPKKIRKKIVYPCIKLIGEGGVDLFKNRF